MADQIVVPSGEAAPTPTPAPIEGTGSEQFTNDFLADLMSETPPEPTPATTPPAPEIPPVVPETPPAPVSEVPSPPAPTPAGTEEPPAKSTEDILREEIARLSGMLANQKITGDAPQAFPTPPATPPATPIGEVPATPASAPTVQVPQTGIMEALKAILEGNFLSQDELDAVIDKPELLNEAYKRSNKTLVENIVQAIPTLVQGEVAKAVQVNRLVTTFYDMYTDLKPHADYVRITMQNIETENPNMTYRDIFEKTATQCRERLGLKATTPVDGGGQANDGKTLPPAFASSRGNQGKAKGTPSTPGAADEDFEAMLRLGGN